QERNDEQDKAGARFHGRILERRPNRVKAGRLVDIPLEQHRAYWLAFGFNSFTRQSNIAATFLRFQAQAERLHRRAVEDFHRLLRLRGQLPPEKYEDPIEPNINPKNEPIPAP